MKKLWLLQRKARAQLVASHLQNMEQYNKKYNLLPPEAVAAGMAAIVTKPRDKIDNSFATTNPVSAYTGLNNNITNRKGTTFATFRFLPIINSLDSF